MNNAFRLKRQALVDSLKEEFVGPLEPKEIISENPVTRYSAGMIFPVGYESRNNKDEASAGNEVKEEVDAASDEIEANDPIDGSANTFFPSVLGMSFYCEGDNPRLKVKAIWTVYRKLEPNEAYIKSPIIPEQILGMDEFINNYRYVDEKLYALGPIDFSVAKTLAVSVEDKKLQSLFYKVHDFSHNSWTNIRNELEITVDRNYKSSLISEGLELVCNRRTVAGSNMTLYTIALKNTFPPCSGGMDEEHVIFDVSLKAESLESKADIFTEYVSSKIFKNDEEDLSLEMLYQDKKAYAIGHGCAANWLRAENSDSATSVWSEILPLYEVPKTNFEISDLDPTTLSMKTLSDESVPSSETIAKLQRFCELYKMWISTLKIKPDWKQELKMAAEKNIKFCQEAHERMVEGVSILDNDKSALHAFRLANNAMLIQSLHSDLQKKKRFPVDEPIVWPDYDSTAAEEKRWRPFQLAFLLLSIKGTTDPKSLDRKLVDLIWFPTGGGKTEAYLGLSAFTIFYRRITKSSSHSGTAVIMRYTLRLLTQQQFQRACTLICAMEKMRRDNEAVLGSDEITVGLWVGMDSTPNLLSQAETDFQKYISGDSDKNPSPIISCPWCGTKTVVENGRRRTCGFKMKSKQANLFCLERSCVFNQRLPVLIVDEEIYRDPPTLLFGTVDKFAQMPVQRGVAGIFASNGMNSPPVLIIQDELHLISGALGTMVGIYETAVDFLCSKGGCLPKIIASTATVRRAGEQCKNLFNRDTRQFPPPGIDIGDFFFSKETSIEDSPGRLYLGVMPSGKTQTTTAVRLTAKLLYTVYTWLAEDTPNIDVIDKYWTIVAYFNSIRELGGYISLLNDDIPIYASALRQRYSKNMRDIRVSRELTSRKNAGEIPEILEQLSVELPNRNTIDVLAATNMLSVGVDVDRLGLMVIRGQPKLTSEYIQVSSRIGRKYPGLVVILYNSAKTRDRAHYERFRTYHESFYRNVEPSSVTPFSSPARARALAAVLLTMFRHGFNPDFGAEDGAALFSLGSNEINELKEYLYQRAKAVDLPEAEETLKDIEILLQKWDFFVKEHNGEVVYKTEQPGKTPVVRKSEKLGGGLWSIPTSMRNVDAECNVEVKDD